MISPEIFNFILAILLKIDQERDFILKLKTDAKCMKSLPE